MRFAQQSSEETTTRVNPATTHEDNAGAMFPVKNQRVGERTKHSSMREHFVRDPWSQGHSDARFVRSEDNESDVRARNVTEKILTTFGPHIRNGALRCWRNWNELNEEIVRSVWREDVAM